MSRVEELVEENSKAELEELAEEFGLSTEGNKPDIAERIADYETGAPIKSDDDTEGAVTTDVLADDGEKPAASPDLPEEIDKPEPVQQADGIKLIKFYGKNPLYTSGGYRFTQDNPFQAVKAELAGSMLKQESDKFRLATEDEVREYYG